MAAPVKVTDKNAASGKESKIKVSIFDDIWAIKTVRHILLALAGSIIFLHCVLPHVHESTIQEALHNKHSSLLCVLKDLVQKDFGEGHLTNFVKSHPQDLKTPGTTLTEASPDFLCNPPEGEFRLHGYRKTAITAYLHITHLLKTGSPLPTRGPPASMTIAGLI